MNNYNNIIRFEETLGDVLPCLELITKVSGKYPCSQRYSRLSESFVMNYVKKRFGEIKRGGSGAAEEIIDSLFDKDTQKTDKRISESEIAKRLSELLVRLAVSTDGGDVAGFFVPLIYGGVITQKNARGESVFVVDFEDRDSEIGFETQDVRLQVARNAIINAIKGGISVICVRGEIRQVLSRELCRLYSEHPDRSFIVIHKASCSVQSGESIYKREELLRLSAIRNLFIAVECDEKGIDAGLMCIRALKCYRKLCGLRVNGGDELGFRNRMIGKQTADGNINVLFDADLSLCSFLGVSGEELRAICYRALESAEGTKVRERGQKRGFFWRDFEYYLPEGVRNKLLERDNYLVLPDILKLLSLIQYISCGGKLMGVRMENV